MLSQSGSDCFARCAMSKQVLTILRELRHLSGREQAAGLHERGSLPGLGIFMSASTPLLSVSTLGERYPFYKFTGAK
jgi:hypothetical protein